MPTIVPTLADQEQRDARLSALRFILDSAETVDESCVNYLNPDGTVDADQIACNPVSNIVRDLGELDAIVASLWEYPLMEAVTAEARIGSETVERARTLAHAIRETLAAVARIDRLEAWRNTQPAEVDEVEDAPAKPRPATTRNLPAGEVEADEFRVEPARVVDDEVLPIKHTGKRARVSSSVIAGQPRAEFEVWVVAIDGDRLEYTTDAAPYWYSVARRSDICDWSLVEGEVVL